MLENNRGTVNNFLICKPYDKPKTAARVSGGPLVQKVARAELIRLEVLVNGLLLEGPQRTTTVWPGCFVYVRADRYFADAARAPLYAEGLETPGVGDAKPEQIQFVVINGAEVIMVELISRKT